MVRENGRSGGAWAAGQARSASYCGEIVTRTPPPASVPRPRRLSRLTLVLARLWPARVHPITDSNEPEAGGGLLPVPDGTGQLVMAGAGNLFPRLRVM